MQAQRRPAEGGTQGSACCDTERKPFFRGSDSHSDHWGRRPKKHKSQMRESPILSKPEIEIMLAEKRKEQVLEGGNASFCLCIADFITHPL